MPSFSHIVLSNRLEGLYEALKEELFRDRNPFSERWVIVPSSAMQNWLQLQWAKDKQFNIATGFSTKFLQSAFTEIVHYFFEDSESFFIPDLTQLAFRIESELRQILSYEVEDSLWSLLIPYLTGPSLLKNEKRLENFSTQLAGIFHRYGVYGRQLIFDWCEEKNTHAHWQKALWQRIFCKNHWKSPVQIIHECLKKIPIIKIDLSVYLFSLGSLSPSFFSFFEHLAKYSPIKIYQFSPSCAFWSDLSSDQEKKYLKRHLAEKKGGLRNIAALELYLENHHSLLANWGKCGRQMARLFEESSLEMIGSFFLPESAKEPYEEFLLPELKEYPTKGPVSRLEAVQVDMLLLRNPEKEKHVFFSNEDCSIQIHKAPSRLREIQILYQNLLHIIHENEGTLEPQEILIMAPDIQKYEPYIQTIFGASDSLLKFQMSDSSFPHRHRIYEGFFKLLEINENRWKSSAVIELLSNPFFLKKQGWNSENIQWLEKWTKEINIKWGFSQSHRHSLIRSQHTVFSTSETSSSLTSWQDGLKRLMEGLIYGSEPSIEPVHAEFLGELNAVLETLFEDLNFLTEATLSLNDWGKYLECLFTTYFSNVEEASILLDVLKRLKTAPSPLNQACFPFTSVFSKLEHLFQQESHLVHAKNIQAVKFCSLLPTRTIPAKLVYLIGMNDEDFPRKDSLSSLNHLSPEHDPYPSKSDLDRYLFLEALLSARHYFLVSFLTQSSQGRENASILVEEFIHYLDTCYSGNASFSQTHVIEHPLFSYSPQYFIEYAPLLKNFNVKDYDMACLQAQPQRPQSFVFVEKAPSTAEKNPHTLIYTLDELSKTVRSPLRSYFQCTLGIFLNDQEEHLDDENFLLSPLQKKIIQEQGRTTNLDVLLQKNYDSGRLPSGIFGKAMHLHLQEIFDQISKFFEHFSIKPQDIISYEISKQSAMTFNVLSQSILITGKMTNLTPSGLIAQGQNHFKNSVKLFPYLLCLAHRFDSSYHQILFMDSLKTQPVVFSHPEKLYEQLIAYHQYCQRHPCFLIPEWIEAILSEDVDALDKKIDQTLNSEYGRSYDPYLKWLFKNKRLPDASTIIKNSQGWAEILFAQVHSWYKEARREKF